MEDASPYFSPPTLGRRIASLDAGDFLLTEAANKPLSSFPRHAHELASVTFVLKGYCVETIGRKKYDCRPFSTIIKPAAEVHANDYGRTGARCLILEVKPSRLQNPSCFAEAFGQADHFRGEGFAALGTRIYKEFKTGDTASVLCIEGLLFEVMGQVARSKEKPRSFIAPKWLVRAKELCHDNFNESLTLFGVAEEVGINAAHLSRTFRRQYGCTLGQYVRRLRLDRAAYDLRQSNKSLLEIAVDCGFYDQSHFTHSFKLHTGMTPSEYRAAMK